MSHLKKWCTEWSHIAIGVFRLNLRVSQVFSAPAAFLGCGAVSHAPSPESNPHYPLQPYLFRMLIGITVTH